MSRCANGSRACPKRSAKRSVRTFYAVQYAWPVGKPLVDNLGEGLGEIRSRLPNRMARTLFAVVDEEIVLHGFIKKPQQTPPRELALAKKRKREYLQNL